VATLLRFFAPGHILPPFDLLYTPSILDYISIVAYKMFHFVFKS
jgi:hypothetical protein